MTDCEFLTPWLSASALGLTRSPNVANRWTTEGPDCTVLSIDVLADKDGSPLLCLTVPIFDLTPGAEEFELKMALAMNFCQLETNHGAVALDVLGERVQYSRAISARAVDVESLKLDIECSIACANRLTERMSRVGRDASSFSFGAVARLGELA